jgi:kelch-like protein 18
MKVCDPDDDGLLIDSERLNPRYCSHLQNHIYLLGGFASNAVHESINIVDMFDTSSKVVLIDMLFFTFLQQWKHMPQMSRCRGRLGVAVLNGMLYALGGFDCAVRLNSAERFDPKTNKWETVASMLFCRSAPACSAMNGRLYVSGGYNGESCLNSCERYDPARDVWEAVPSMQRSRSAAAAVCFAGKMFVTGGCDVVQFFNSVEVFDGKKWTEFPPMIHNRCRHGSLVFQGKLWVVGGYNGRFLQTCEQYSFATQQWTPMTQVRELVGDQSTIFLGNERAPRSCRRCLFRKQTLRNWRI